jgi:hypothetical protein
MAILQLIILFVIVAIIVTLVRALPKSNCTGSCIQGRDCDCSKPPQQ